MWAIARIFTDVSVLAGSAWLVARYRFLGLVISVFVGWGILALVYWYLLAPPDSGDWDEDHEDVPRFRWALMAVWCAIIYFIVNLRAWVKERGRRSD